MNRENVDWPRHELLIMRELTRKIGSSLDPGGVIRHMLHLLSEFLGLNRGRVLLYDAAEDMLRIAYAYGLTQEEQQRGRFRPGEGVTGRVFVSSETAVIQDIDADPLFLCRTVARERLPQETVAFIALPIEVDGKAVGVLGVHRLRRRDRAIADDLNMLGMVATLIGQALQISRLAAARTAALREENRELRRALQHDAAAVAGAGGFIGQSPQLYAVLARIERFAATDVTTLILGETGTGKELLARAIHLRSGRRDGPLVKVNCAAIPDSLFESELFGHEKGAFTGATGSQAGRFEQAEGGTLFLDEIGEVPLALQAKLLRALQERVVERIGSKRERKVDVRIIAATNRDLQQLVHEGRFRTDLFYRLNVMPVWLPPLRERTEDIRPLVQHFLQRCNERHDRAVRFSEYDLALLERAPWPGNVRQLENFIERAVLLHDDASQATLFIENLLATESPSQASLIEQRPKGSAATARTGRPYVAVSAAERTTIDAALRQSHGNKSRAAQLLGLSLRQLEYRILRLEIDLAPYRH